MKEDNDIMVNVEDLYYHGYEGADLTEEERINRHYEQMQLEKKKDEEATQRMLDIRAQEKKRDAFVIASLVLMIGGMIMFIYHTFLLSQNLSFQADSEMVYATVTSVVHTHGREDYDNFAILSIDFDYKGHSYSQDGVFYRHGEFISKGNVLKAYVHVSPEGKYSVRVFNNGFEVAWSVVGALGAAIGGVMFFLYHFHSKRYTKQS